MKNNAGIHLSPLAIAVRTSLFGLGLAHGSIHAATIAVNSTNDTETSVSCTLRQAIQSINLGGEDGTGCIPEGIFGTDDTITFNPINFNTALARTITLANSSELAINSDVTIDASTVSGITIDAAQGSRIFNVANTISLTTSNITATNGNSGNGGAIYLGMNSTLNMTNSSVSNNVAVGEGSVSGGGIYGNTNAAIVLNNTTVTGNTAAQDGGGIFLKGGVGGGSLLLNGSFITNNIATNNNGGGLAVSGDQSTNSIDTTTVSLVNSEVSGNTSASYGGGVYVANNVSLIINSNNTVSGNTTGDYGGGIAARDLSAGLVVQDSNITNNVTTNQGGSYGGGIFAQETAEVSILRSNITGNSTGLYGAGVYVNGGTVTITNSNISSNSAYGDGGGVYTSQSSLTVIGSTISNNLAGSDDSHEGGGIWTNGGYLSVDSSTISGNSAYYSGGGIYSSRNTTIIRNSTISGNSSQYYGGGISSGSITEIENSTISGNSAQQYGGGIYTSSDSLTLTNTTLSNNAVAQPNAGGGIYNNGAVVTLVNSIVANSTNSDCINSSGTLTSDSPSIIEDGSCASSARSGDPGLLPLDDNGGLTQTHALSVDSIARDTGDNNTCLATDQTGANRNDGACDVGSVEFRDDASLFVIPLPNGKLVVVPL